MKAAPTSTPTTVTGGDPIFDRESNPAASRPGMMREKKGAVSVTPAADPNSAVLARCNINRQKIEGNAPASVIRPAKRLATKPIQTRPIVRPDAMAYRTRRGLPRRSSPPFTLELQAHAQYKN